MSSFVYVSGDYKNAWLEYVWNLQKFEHWETFDDDFKSEFDFKFHEQVHSLNKFTRPPSWYLNDKLGKDQFLFKTSSDFYPVVEYEYTNNLPSFRDIMLDRATEMRDMGKVIDIFYSGGIDSTAILYALLEVCPKDQLRLIMGDESSVNIYPKAVENLSYEFAEGNIFGMANIDTNLFTTGCEADRLFGGTGYPHSRNTNEEKFILETEYEYHHSRWWDITRYTLTTQSFRFLQNIEVSSFDIKNYQPFFLSPQIEKFAINQHFDRDVVWHKNHWTKPEDFLTTKIAIRDFIAEWDKDYAYTMVKTDMPFDVQREIILPLPTNYNVLAITSDGIIVNRKNLMEYMSRDFLDINI
jgi:hypothetical protein